MEITLQLPETIYRNVSLIAEKSKRKVVDLIVDSVQEKYSAKPFSNLSDEEVLGLAKPQMPKKQSILHSELLYKNQAGTLKPSEKQELYFFQEVYGVALA